MIWLQGKCVWGEGGFFCLAKVKLQFGGFDSWVILDGRDFVLLFWESPKQNIITKHLLSV